MKALCHKQLGSYLADQYISKLPRRYSSAFKLGCVEPDKNFTTYFKGSLRHEWMRGHNWGNTTRYMGRISYKLERKKKLRLLDYYKMGKLIHYTADAFTFAHNEAFGENLKEHCIYEAKLQQYMPALLSYYRHNSVPSSETVFNLIRAYHKDYLSRPRSVHTDAAFSVFVCSSVLERLTQGRQ